MILGGSNEGGYLDTVELFNIQTHQSCNFGTLPYYVIGLAGGVLDGVPVFCGGESYTTQYENRCYKFEKSWSLVRNYNLRLTKPRPNFRCRFNKKKLIMYCCF